MAKEKGVKYVAKGIEAQGRAKAYKRRAVFRFKKSGFPTHPKQTKNAEEKQQVQKFYPADDTKKPLKRKVIRNPTKLKSSIKPGSILILLTGRFKGKRVVFLKQLPSGLLLVTGPYDLNGVPARRVNQKFVIATQTRVPLPKDLDLSAFSDDFFTPVEKKQKKQFLEGEEKKAKKSLPQEYIDAQKKLDSQVSSSVKDKNLKGYLSQLFSLSDGDRPHLMKF